MLSVSIAAIGPLALGGGSGSALSRCLMTGLPTRENPPVLRMPGPAGSRVRLARVGLARVGLARVGLARVRLARVRLLPRTGPAGPGAGPAACQAPVFLPWPN